MYESAATIVPRRRHISKQYGLSRTLDTNRSTEQASVLTGDRSGETGIDNLSYSTPLAIRPTLTVIGPLSSATTHHDALRHSTTEVEVGKRSLSSSSTYRENYAEGYTPLRSSIIDAGDECRPIDPILLYAATSERAGAEYQHHLIETADSGTDLAASQACVFEWCKFASYDQNRRRSNKRHAPITMTHTLRLRHIKRVPHQTEQTTRSRISTGGTAISHVVPTPTPVACNTISKQPASTYYATSRVKIQGYPNHSVFSPSNVVSSGHTAPPPPSLMRQTSTSPPISPQRITPLLTHQSHVVPAMPAPSFEPPQTTTTTSSGASDKMWLRKSSSIVIPPTKIYTYSQLGSLSPDALQRLALKPTPESPPHIMTLKRYPSTVHSTPTTPAKIRSFDFSPKMSLTNPLSPVSSGSPSKAALVESSGSTHFRSLTSIRRTTPRISHFASSSSSLKDEAEHTSPMASPNTGAPSFVARHLLSSHTPEAIPETIPEASEVTFTSAKSKATTMKSFHSPANDITDLYGPKVESWEKLYARCLQVFDNKDNSVGHGLLVQLQNEILDCLQALRVQPHFALTSALKSGDSVNLGIEGLVNEQTLQNIKKRLKPITDVLEESGIPFFQRYQITARHITGESGSAAKEVEKFLKEVGMGPKGGRSEVNNPLRSLRDMPVVVYGCGPLDKKLQTNLVPCPKSGPARWTAMSRGCCPLKVSVVFCGDSNSRSEEEITLLKQLESLLGRMLSDWRCHKLRLFEFNALRYQAFLPVVTDVPSKDLAQLGWGEMVFNGDCVIRWKTIDGGLILAFIAGVAEAAVSKVLSLVYDGDNHAKWIPFLTDTKREFALSRSEFVFSYAVSLPWPLNKRELTLHGMATDALLVSPIHAIQMWGTNVPEAATSLFGVPLPSKKNKGVTQMEMPVLSFSLTPVAPEKTYVRMVSVMDVKIGFIPMAVQNYMAKHMATKMFGNVQKICKDFDKSEYKKVMMENKEYFEELNENVAAAMSKAKH